MKYLMVLITVFFYSTILAQENQFPVVSTDTVQAGNLFLIEGISLNEKSDNYPKNIVTTFGTLAVPENREKTDTRLITLPVKKLHSFNKKPKEPVFLLYGGPGMSNLQPTPFLWLLENHDIVMVGYRGVDGQVSLENYEFPKAMVSDGNPFSSENLKNLGNASLTAYNRLKSEGIDVDAYNMIEVIDDVETARNALGYQKINLFGISYGTRVAYLYGLRYPESINRTFLQAVNPPGGFVWQPELIDSLFIYLGEQWKNNPECVAKTPDILKTMETVFETLPLKWREITVNPDKAKIMMFLMAYTRKGMAQIFDALVAAENDDYSGLAFLCMAYDQLPEMPGMNWGDNLSKAFSADYDPETDYETAMDPEGSIIGSPMSRIFGLMKYGGWPIQRIPEEYRKLRISNVETLMLSGTIDISTPASNGTQLLKYLPNGHQVILSDRGHQDLGGLEKDAYNNLINTYFSTGKVDDSGFTNMPIDFNDIKPTFQEMGIMLYNKFAEQQNK